MAKKITNMHKLAKELHLSRCTVSYVLNNKWRENRISENTAKKVLDYVEKTEFVPNFLSMTLKGKANKDVAILLPSNCLDHEKRAFFEFLKIIENMNFTYMVFPLKSNEQNLKVVHQLNNYKIRNVIVLSGRITLKDMEWWKKSIDKVENSRWLFYDFRFPVHRVLKNSPPNVTYIGFNNLDAEKTVYKYVADANYQNIILSNGVCNRPNILSYIKELSLNVKMFFKWPDSDNGRIENGKLIAQEILNFLENDINTAVFINDDYTTIGAIRYMMSSGIRIPEQYAFISWDGLPESEYFLLPLTTLVIPHTEMILSVDKWLNNDMEESIIEFKPYIRPGLSLSALK